MTDKPKADTIYGIEAIADHVGMTARQAKYSADTGQLPSFKMGRTVCASALNQSDGSLWAGDVRVWPACPRPCPLC